MKSLERKKNAGVRKAANAPDRQAEGVGKRVEPARKALGIQYRVVKGHHGDGELRECGDSGRASLSKDEADSLLQHSNRLQSLQRAKANVQELGGSLGASLSGTIDRVLHTEVKMYNQRTNFSAVVQKELRESLDAEERHFRKQRTELQDIMGMKTEKKRVAEELAGVKEELKKARTAQREGEQTPGGTTRGLEDLYPRDVGTG